mmetsp:Transcript_52360/g.109234  ORF Transcript_52360/g.109234 Transcript_52360/m.109234 type:complete len:102 (-) Transcript_52360:196-501(-)
MIYLPHETKHGRHAVTCRQAKTAATQRKMGPLEAVQVVVTGQMVEEQLARPGPACVQSCCSHSLDPPQPPSQALLDLGSQKSPQVQVTANLEVLVRGNNVQ